MGCVVVAFRCRSLSGIVTFERDELNSVSHEGTQLPLLTEFYLLRYPSLLRTPLLNYPFLLLSSFRQLSSLTRRVLSLNVLVFTLMSPA